MVGTRNIRYRWTAKIIPSYRNTGFWAFCRATFIFYTRKNACTTCCKLSTGVNNVVLPTVNKVVLLTVNNVVLLTVNKVVLPTVNDVVLQPVNNVVNYCYNLLTRLSNNDSNNEQTCSINTVLLFFYNREKTVVVSSMLNIVRSTLFVQQPVA